MRQCKQFTVHPSLVVIVAHQNRPGLNDVICSLRQFIVFESSVVRQWNACSLLS